jgi:hypothetical protein
MPRTKANRMSGDVSTDKPQRVKLPEELSTKSSRKKERWSSKNINPSSIADDVVCPLRDSPRSVTSTIRMMP